MLSLPKDPIGRAGESISEVAADLERSVPGIRNWMGNAAYVPRAARIFGIEANTMNAEQFAFLESLLQDAFSFEEQNGDFDEHGQLYNDTITLRYPEKYARDLSRELRLFLQSFGTRGIEHKVPKFSFYIVEGNNTELRVADARRYSDARITRVCVSPLGRNHFNGEEDNFVTIVIRADKVESDTAVIKDAQTELTRIDALLNTPEQREARWNELSREMESTNAGYPVKGQVITGVKEVGGKLHVSVADAGKPAIKKPVASKRKPAVKVAVKKATPAKKTAAKKAATKKVAKK